MRYSDHFSCVCGEQYIINIPMKWAYANSDEFQKILAKQLEVRRDHYLCLLVSEVKAFLKQPVIIEVR